MNPEGQVETEAPAVETEAVAFVPEEAPLPLIALDAALDPVRRTLAYSLSLGPLERDRAVPRYFAVNARRALAPALALDLPHAVRERLAALSACFVEHDARPEAERLLLRLEAAQLLARLDALLGLPLRSRGRGRPRPRVVPADAPEERSRPERGAAGEERRSAGEERRSAGEDRRAAAETKPALLAKKPAVAKPADESAERERGERGGRGRRRDRREGREGRAEGAAPELIVESRPEPRERRYRPGDPEHLGRPLSDMGVAESVLQALAAAGIETPWALLTTRPIGETVLKPIHGAGRDIPPGLAAVGGRVVARATRCLPNGTQRSEVLVRGAGLLRALWSSAAPGWLLERLKVGERVVLAGRWEAPEGDEGGVLWDPELVVEDGQHGARLAQYGLDGLEEHTVRALVTWLLPHVEQVRDPVPADVLARVSLPPLAEAVTDLHQRGGAAPKARARFAFDEAMLAVVAQSALARKQGRERGLSHYVAHAQIARLTQTAELRVSDSQQMALEDIKRDLRSAHPMFRVLSGPVGSGRGLVALLAGISVVEAKAQVLWICPPGVHGELRSIFCEPLLRELTLTGRFAADSPNASVREPLRRGEIHFLFGPPSLLKANLEFRRLGLVVIEDRALLAELQDDLAAFKGARPDVLVLTPSEAPALSLLGPYATADFSEILPSRGRKVHGRAFPVSARAEAYARAGALRSSGEQVLVVFPLSRGAESLDGREALRVKAALESDAFRGARVGLFHSSLGREDRLRTIEDWRHRRLDVLISTLPVEDGPPIPGLGAVVIEQAAHFGLERILRLRALLAESTREEPAELLCVVDAAHDDPKVAEVERWARDRGGDGASSPKDEDTPPDTPPDTAADASADNTAEIDFVWLDPTRDRALAVLAHREARALVAADPQLKRGNHSDLGHVLGAIGAAGAAASTSTAAGTEDEGEDGDGAGGKGRRRRRRKKR